MLSDRHTNSLNILESAKEQLVALQEREDTGVLVIEIDNEDDGNKEDEDELEGGIIVPRNISLETYLNYYKGEARLTVDTRLLDGNYYSYPA
ncbi:hypothetical protein RCL_jg6979.t1 [Rhizophagus clarus]|uniref:Uncharacterized protein n=1 Tax=Rhizophagus clarus TaxID=94130 RepID=A0A8H3LEU6_9GLOM|nr:hypothetical protein RCL_jg6979.t1 [Rhizophagus clarus]